MNPKIAEPKPLPRLCIQEALTSGLFLLRCHGRRSWSKVALDGSNGTPEKLKLGWGNGVAMGYSKPELMVTCLILFYCMCSRFC